MGEKLSGQEIKQRYPDEWVILVEFERNGERVDVNAGVVLDHDRSRKALMVRTKEPLAG